MTRMSGSEFLNLLAKYRKKEPLNGLVVAIAADRLLEAGPEALEEDGRQIRRRIDELMRVLGSKFPVYVLVTKCDLVQGMTQFCGQLDDELLQQAFGRHQPRFIPRLSGFYCHVRSILSMSASPSYAWSSSTSWRPKPLTRPCSSFLKNFHG